jgi:flagellar biogenesis protein FliO
MIRKSHFFVRLSSLAFLVALLIFILCAVGFGQTTRPSENLIHRTGPHSSIAPAAGPQPGRLDLPRVAGSLVIVIALIYATRWMLRKLAPATARSTASRAVQVLSRNVISSKQKVLILQVGRRLIVVGDNGQQLSTLCEITDSQESAALLAQLRRESDQPASKTFSALLGRAAESFGSSGPAAGAEKIRRADEPGAGPVVTQSASLDEVDLGLATTREELDGLLEKVREMRQTFDGRQPVKRG